MNRRSFMRLTISSMLAAKVLGKSPSSLPVAVSEDSDKKRWNFLFVLVDDLGWSDLGCYGNEFIDTPNIDRLSEQGMRFTSAYAMPVCTPTRVCVQTGKNNASLNIQHPNPHVRPWAKLLVPEQKWQLDASEITIAEALKPAGYVCGHFGKWGSGYSKGHLSEDQGYIKPEGRSFKKHHYTDKLEKFARENPYKGIGRQLRQGIQFIEENQRRPFLCTLSYKMVHSPPEAKEALIEKYKKRRQEYRTVIHPEYAAMVETVDETMGILEEILTTLNLRENTIVIFYSDNGGVISERGYLRHGFEEVLTHNWPLRGEKGSLYEGGIRVPLIISWPGKVKAGTLCDTPVICHDLLPTFLHIAGVEHPNPEIVDGKSLVPLLKQTENLDREALYWHYPRYHHSSPCAAIRQGDYKLIKYYENNQIELYNLRDDIGEQFDLSNKQKEEAFNLQEKLDQWLRSVDARVPKSNPEYDPDKEIIWGERLPKKWWQKDEH